VIDIKAVKDQARAEIAKEHAEGAKAALVKKLREHDAAKRVVANIEREIADLEQSIIDGSFVAPKGAVR
jgi:predicted  nucleic acid-binding Zn-ribbon protein